MNIIIYIDENCNTCKRIIKTTENLVEEFNSVNLVVKNIKDNPLKATIVPAIYLDDTLLFYGDYDTEKLKKYILSSET